jgi:RNA polymerase sigma-70 factor (ECF subfamily)
MSTPPDAALPTQQSDISREDDDGSAGRASKPDYARLDDGELMRAIGQGDRDAFAAFCRRHGGRCLSIAHHLLRNEADAEEVVQDAFIRVWRTAARWRATEARVTTWLYRVTVNLALDQMRRATRTEVSIEHAAEVTTADPSPESIVGQRELARVVLHAVAALPPRQRAALNLVVRDGVACAEAAAIMGVSVGTMESLLVRGRRSLRAALDAATRERPQAMVAAEPPAMIDVPASALPIAG